MTGLVLRPLPAWLRRLGRELVGPGEPQATEPIRGGASVVRGSAGLQPAELIVIARHGNPAVSLLSRRELLSGHGTHPTPRPIGGQFLNRPP